MGIGPGGRGQGGAHSYGEELAGDIRAGLWKITGVGGGSWSGVLSPS